MFKLNSKQDINSMRADLDRLEKLLALLEAVNNFDEEVYSEDFELFKSNPDEWWKKWA